MKTLEEPCLTLEGYLGPRTPSNSWHLKFAHSVFHLVGSWGCSALFTSELIFLCICSLSRHMSINFRSFPCRSLMCCVPGKPSWKVWPFPSSCPLLCVTARLAFCCLLWAHKEQVPALSLKPRRTQPWSGQSSLSYSILKPHNLPCSYQGGTEEQLPTEEFPLVPGISWRMFRHRAIKNYILVANPVAGLTVNTLLMLISQTPWAIFTSPVLVSCLLIFFSYCLISWLLLGRWAIIMACVLIKYWTARGHWRGSLSWKCTSQGQGSFSVFWDCVTRSPVIWWAKRQAEPQDPDSDRDSGSGRSRKVRASGE